MNSFFFPLTCQVSWCTGESTLDCSRTISVGQNAHRLAKNSVPANNGNRECVLRVTGIRLLMDSRQENLRNLNLYCKSLDGTKPFTVCYTLCCLATIHQHSGSGTFRAVKLTCSHLTHRWLAELSIKKFIKVMK